MFRAEGAQGKSDLHLTQAEIDRLLTLADTLMPRSADDGMRSADDGMRSADVGMRSADVGMRSADVGMLPGG
ncbi:hypothetical protein [Polyangium fumosum]|uniref:hypothetical protein n=1 Tax=Polyangium fumosum TaxID=889272 RepID=UPI0014792EEB|nr:hypothetical protein [Polyangium fumosum]